MSYMYAVRDKSTGWTRFLCVECLSDHPKDDYRFGDHYHGTPEPVSRDGYMDNYYDGAPDSTRRTWPPRCDACSGEVWSA